MKKHSLSSYNTAQVALFKIIKASEKNRNKINMALNKAISKNDIYQVILLSDQLVKEVSGTNMKAHTEMKRINAIEDPNLL